MATEQSISLSADGKVIVGKAKPVKPTTDAKMDRAMQEAVRKSCDVGKAYPVPVKRVG